MKTNKEHSGGINMSDAREAITRLNASGLTGDAYVKRLDSILGLFC